MVSIFLVPGFLPSTVSLYLDLAMPKEAFARASLFGYIQLKHFPHLKWLCLSTIETVGTQFDIEC